MAKGGALDDLTGEFVDQLPQLLPDLTPEEVTRFTALGEDAEARLRAGDEAAAEALARAQLALFPGNPEPHVFLALLAARRGDATGALAHLRDAVVRGFRDMDRVSRAEAWIRLRRSMEFETLCWAVPILEQEERRRTGWSAVPQAAVPSDVRSVLEPHERLRARVEALAPALGPRLVALWGRKIDQSVASRLEAYAAARPGAPDLPEALSRLMVLYPGGGLDAWQVLEVAPARRLQAVAATALSRFPDSPMRAGALACRALAANAVRDGHGRLDPRAAAAATADLEAVLRAGPSPYARVAASGLVQLEIEQDRWPQARARFAALEPALRDAVRADLGPAALRVSGLPEFRATALDGTPVDAPGLRGQVTVLDFWATWCHPCVEEFPTLKRIAARHGNRVQVVGINLDRSEEITPDALRAWVAEEGLPGRHLHDGLSWESALVAAFGVREIPLTVVVAADGEVRAVGAHGRELEKAVAAALKGDS